MKHVVSVSLGSSKRDHRVEIELLGERFLVERLGTDGNMHKALELISELDGKAAAIGMGGISLYISAGNKRYMLRDGKKMQAAAKDTPIVDGSGLKHSLESRAVVYFQQQGYDFEGKKALVVCAMDRMGMAQALQKAGCHMTYGDLIFSLGLPIPLYSLRALGNVARVIAPIASQLPIAMLYPIGRRQETSVVKHSKYYDGVSVVAGDFHYIKRYMPPNMRGKVVITNTVTAEDVDVLQQRGVSSLITTTPELQGRSFGTNVMEALLIAVEGSKSELTEKRYDELLDIIGFVPRVSVLNKEYS